MIKSNLEYESIESIFIESKYALEKVIGVLEKSINNTEYGLFLIKYISNKVKLDFMKATYSIVKENLTNIYNNNSNDIYILFNKFQNYFTLNFDPLLYLLLLKYKKNNSLLAFEYNKQLQIFMDEINTEDYEILSIIKDSFNNGIVNIKTTDINLNYELANIGKSEFQNHIKRIVKNKYPNVNDKAIKNLSKKFFEFQINNNPVLKIDDGFNGEIFRMSDEDKKQNIFYLHGAFHIYELGNYIKKILKTDETSFNDKLEDILEDETEELIVVFQSENKSDIIEGNEYLKKSFDRLGEIEGDIVIFGSSLEDNDKHIFNKINTNDKIHNVYISSSKLGFKKSFERASLLFPNKSIYGFDYETVTYSKCKDKK